MSGKGEEKLSFNEADFKRWKIPELKTFLKKWGLKMSVPKNELMALVYGAVSFPWTKCFDHTLSSALGCQFFPILGSFQFMIFFLASRFCLCGNG